MDSIELKHVATGEASNAFAFTNNPTTPHGGLAGKTNHLEVYHVPLAIFVSESERGSPLARDSDQGSLEAFGMLDRYAKARCEDTCFVATARMLGIQAVVAQFFDVDDRIVAIRQLHFRGD
jgi:hypothetical protein